MMSKKYTVWAGGVEVKDYYLTLENATRLSDEWKGKILALEACFGKDDGYDDVTIEEVNDE